MRAAIGDWLNQRALRVHRSRLGWREAPKYTRHWRRCQREAPRDHRNWRETARQFWKYGSVSFGADDGNPRFFLNTGYPVDCFLRAVFQSDYTIYFAKSYASEWTPERSGSQLWHADGGPGTCINVMRYDSNVSHDDGPLQVVRWSRSLDIFAQEPRGVPRDQLCDWYESRIKVWDRTTYLGPVGTVIAFMNNTLHRGGYPDPGHVRNATVYHVYPSLRGSKVISEKTDAYPRNPDI